MARPETVPGGEAVKNDPQLVERLQRRLLELGIDRHSYVVAIGGGAVLDLIGYVAATTHRGVRHVRVPTTVLAQNDSGVGVKNGVNAFGVKNFARHRSRRRSRCSTISSFSLRWSRATRSPAWPKRSKSP